MFITVRGLEAYWVLQDLQGEGQDGDRWLALLPRLRLDELQLHLELNQ